MGGQPARSAGTFRFRLTPHRGWMGFAAPCRFHINIQKIVTSMKRVQAECARTAGHNDPLHSGW
jgi:hypothetical protein